MALQCSCLENPRDGGAWWAAVYGVAQSQIQLSDLAEAAAAAVTAAAAAATAAAVEILLMFLKK